MTVYFDYKNLVSYLTADKNIIFADCNRMLKNKCRIRFNFDKNYLRRDSEQDSLEILEIKQSIMSWINTMTDGLGSDTSGNVSGVTFGEPFPPRKLKSNLYNSLSQEQLMSVYLLDDEAICNIREYGFMLFGAPGDEIKVLNQLILDDDYQFGVRLNIREMKDWKQLIQYASPTTDIIFVDQYLFSAPEIMEYNATQLLKDLCKHAHNTKVNIIIFTTPSYYDKEKKTTFVPDWDNIRKTFKKAVGNTVGIEPNITFVLSSNLNEHDRQIFTNYKSFSSGDSMNYFNSKGFISKGRYLHINSVASKDILNQNLMFLNDMQAIIQQVLKTNNEKMLIGDKKSCFLKFHKD